MWRTTLVLALATVVTGCGAIEPIDAAPPLASLPATDQARVLLGQRLFHEKGLSQDGSTACVSCHAPEHAGADAKITSSGVNGQRGARNAPTVQNTSLRTVWFWDGRADTLEEQARGPLLNPLEMAGTETEIVAFLEADSEYRAAFTSAFGTGAITLDHVTSAVAAYERQLVAPSKVDRHLRGERVLSASEERGLAKFDDCMRCHDGPGVGGTRFATLGEEQPWPHRAQRRPRSRDGHGRRR